MKVPMVHKKGNVRLNEKQCPSEKQRPSENNARLEREKTIRVISPQKCDCFSIIIPMILI